MELVNEGSSKAIEKSDADASRCGRYSAFSRPMLSAIELEGHLGASTAEKLIRAQPISFADWWLVSDRRPHLESATAGADDEWLAAKRTIEVRSDL